MRRARWGALLCALGLSAGCSLDLDDPGAVIHARFDPEAKVIPMPSDILRDEVAGKLAIPIDDELTTAERYLYEHLNHMGGWSSASAALVELDGVVDPATVDPDTLEVWRWGAAPARVFDDQSQVTAAFKAGELARDVVVIVRFQGPRANGMPELHQLTPCLASR